MANISIRSSVRSFWTAPQWRGIFTARERKSLERISNSLEVILFSFNRNGRCKYARITPREAGEDGRLDLGRKAMPGWLDVVFAELLDEVGADEEGGGEEDFDDDEYCDYHCSCFFSC